MKTKNVIFGIRTIIEAIKAGKEFDKVMLKKGLLSEAGKELFSLLRELEIPFQYVPVEKLDRITGKNHQGAIAFLSRITYYDIEQIIPDLFEQGKIPFILILDGITDVRNFGAIIRSAECAGVDAVIVPAKGTAQINEDSIKTSAGAIFSIPICRSSNLISTVKFLKNCGISVFSATERGGNNYFEVDYKVPAGLILGSEEDGISNELIALSEKNIKIPLLGQIASLNVSVAAGIILFEAVRQRM